MANTQIYSATEARTKLFEIMNQVYYGSTDVYIKKNNTVMVKITKPTTKYSATKNVYDLAGTLAQPDATYMKSEIARLKKLPSRRKK